MTDANKPTKSEAEELAEAREALGHTPNWLLRGTLAYCRFHLRLSPKKRRDERLQQRVGLLKILLDENTRRGQQR